jgi:DNA (cytosine-5)-methyltransferase 1
VGRDRARVVRYISLFSGGFGLDLGMEAAGFVTAACVEIAPAMRQTIRFNRPGVVVIGDEDNEAGGDLYRLSTEYILGRAGFANDESPDLIVGGPPCQAFSILGNRQGFEDPRGNLMLEYVRVIREAKPRAFVMENVAGLLNLHKGAAIAQVENLLRQAGYGRIVRWLLNAADYGVPQFRERVFLVGFRDDIPTVPVDSPLATHRAAITQPRTLFDNMAEPDNRLPYRHVEDALRNMPQDLPNHEPRIHGDRVSSRYAVLLPGARDKVDHTDRLRWDRPSGTVLVGSSGGGGRPFIHPEHPRHLSVREAARLQAFPDDWVFQGNQTDQYRQVGNAVPPPLATAVARHIAPYLQRRTGAGSAYSTQQEGLMLRTVLGK